MRPNLSLLLAVAAPCAALFAGCTTTTARPAYSWQSKSWTEKVTDSLKSGTEKLTSALVSKRTVTATDNVLEPNKKPGPAVYVAWAQIQERAGNIEEAEIQLRKALALDPNHVGALLAYAHLEDRQRNFQAALKHYNRAVKKHPKNASVRNDLGLCYHRHNKLDDASEALAKAVELEPHQKLYRDNLAAVLVDQDKASEALAQLIEAHGRPVGHYNLAYLLVQKHDTSAALQHFRQAAQLDPSFDEARQWIVQLSAPPQPPGAGGTPVAMMAHRQSHYPGYPPGQVAPGNWAPPHPASGSPAANPHYPLAGAPPSYPATAPQPQYPIR